MLGDLFHAAAHKSGKVLAIKILLREPGEAFAIKGVLEMFKGECEIQNFWI
jgi:hypothetical protein